MDTVRIGLIGFGKWPREAYAPALRESAVADVVAVAARSGATHAAAREVFGGELRAYEDYDALLADPEVEAVMIALPNPLHSQAIRAAAASGKHVFFEPPLGLGTAQNQAALEALMACEAVVQVDHELRYVPVVRFVREKLAEGCLGRPLMATVRLWADWGHGGSEYAEEAGPQGFFPWLGCWYLDALDALIDAPAVRAAVVGGYAMNDRLMDHGWATLQYEGGAIGQFEFSMVAVEGQQTTLHVACTGGEVRADIWSGDCRWRTEEADWQHQAVPCAQPISGFAGMRESIGSFLQAIARGEPVEADLAVIRRVHEAMLACHRSEKTHMTEKVTSL